VTADEQIVPPRPAVELTRAESWQLLAGVSLGRFVFTQRAMPAVRLVNHLTDNRSIIIRTHLGAAIAGRSSEDGAVVCYEADDIDRSRHTGWSVIVTGTARLVRDPAAVRRYEPVLQPWTDGQRDCFIAITPQLITGLRLVGWCR
jgi:hypothetical protein